MTQKKEKTYIKYFEELNESNQEYMLGILRALKYAQKTSNKKGENKAS